MTSRQTRYRTRIRAERKAAGLCVDCGAKPEPDWELARRKREGHRWPRGPGRPTTGYRCEACNIKRRRK